MHQSGEMKPIQFALLAENIVIVITKRRKKMKLLQKIAEIRKELDYLQKDTKGFNYKYVAGVTILGKIHDRMNELGMLLYPEITEQSVEPISILTKTGQKTEMLVKSLGSYVWIDIETGDTLKVPWSFTGQQADASQAFGSGLTYAERYFLMKFFNVPTDEADPDKIRSSQQQKEKESEELSLEDLKKKVKNGFKFLNYSESNEKLMREEYLGENPIDEDYKILLKKLRNEAKKAEK